MDKKLASEIVACAKTLDGPLVELSSLVDQIQDERERSQYALA
jgi:hypothetical protein